MKSVTYLNPSFRKPGAARKLWHEVKRLLCQKIDKFQECLSYFWIAGELSRNVIFHIIAEDVWGVDDARWVHLWVTGYEEYGIVFGANFNIGLFKCVVSGLEAKERR